MNNQREIERNLLHIFHAEGTESFPVTSATFNLCEEAGRTLLVVCVDCGKARVPIPEFEDLFHPEPWFEIVLPLERGGANLQAGATFFQSPGYDYAREEHITNFYYVSHCGIEELKLEVLQYAESSGRFRIDGLTGAAHGEADTLFAIDTEIVRDSALERSIR